LIEDAGYETMLYSGANELSGGLWDLDTLGKDTLIWVAQYPETPYPKQEFPDYDGKVDAWQFTDRGKIGGIESNVDLVVCYFTRDEKNAKDPDKKPEIKVPKSQDELEYTPCNEAVTAKIEVNLREGPTTSSEIVATLRNPDTLTRVGVGKNGWSRLEFGDTYVYAISSYLTTDLTPPKEEPNEDIVGGMLFTPTEDSVTAKIEVNLRESPTTDSAIVGVLKSGTFLPRTAISTHGWSRLTFEGRAVYAVSSYLSTTVVEAPPPDDGFSAVDEQVTAKSETNLRTAPSTTSSEIVYTLKHGEFVHRVGIHPNGWSKLEYDGKTVYAVTSYLTTETEVEE
ncbi:MAG: SH3 domain-containing protein, partial [Clostridia bacterium]|nr:SH3 domain-containing protein [Clostridia bacterium]